MGRFSFSCASASLALALAGCGSGDAAPSETGAATDTSTAASTSATSASTTGATASTESTESSGSGSGSTGASPTCGDGSVDAGEVCDGDCPTSCESVEACASAILVGSPETCDAECVIEPIEACGGRDGCCPSGCNTPDDFDCIDSDRDGLGDVMEDETGSDPANPDSDGDGFYDWDEVLRATDPLDGSDYPLPYDGLERYAGDPHVHAATAMEVAPIFWGYDYGSCGNSSIIGGNTPHSHVWCDRVYDRAKANGLDWVNVSSHGLGVLDRLPDFGDGKAYREAVMEFWTQNPDFADPVHGDDPDYRYPTHPDGFPLWTEPGHTDSEWLSLQRCADFKTEPGTFVAFGGIEYTAQAGGDGCGPAAYCGGHKTVMYLHESDKLCAATYVKPEENCNETGLYENIRAHAGVANIAHPDWLGPTLVPHDPSTAKSGIDDAVLMGVELRFGGTTDLEEGKPGHDYRAMLDAGFKTQPVAGSDTHNWPENTCGGSAGPGNGAGGNRTVCWGTGLTRGEILGSYLQHRCYYTSRGKPDVRFAIEDRPMGSKLTTSLIADPNAGIHITLSATRNDGHSLGEWDLVHNGAVVPAFTDVACEVGGETCTYEGYYNPADPTGYYYVRITDGAEPGQKRVITAPIWID